MQWRDALIQTPAGIRDLLARTRRIAVLGIKTQAQAGQPAYSVPDYLLRTGFDVIPVPVYFPEVTRILDRPIYRRLVDVPGRIDLVNVFRRPQDLPAHLDDMLAANPSAVWFQQGIRDDAVAQALAQAGILVVQDRCLMVDHRELMARPAAGRL